MAINPLQAPINYAVDVQSPFEAALGGLKLGAGLAEIDAAQQKRQLEINAAQQAQQRQTDLANLYKNPNATSADYARVAAFLPKDQAAIVTQGFERLTKEQQQSDLRMGGEVYSAIKSGNLDVAKRMLTDKAAALRNSGRESEAKAAEDSLELINLNPTGAQATIGLYMARLPGGKDFLDNADKALSTLRAEEKAPSELAAAKAAATKAVAEAQKAFDEAEGTPLRLATERELLAAQAAKAKVEAQFASPLAQAELNKRIAETLAPSVREAIDFKNLSPTDQAVFQNLQILKKPPAAVTNVNVSNVDKTAAGELGKLVPDLYTQMNAASDLTGELARYRTALGTAITGPFADRRLQVAQVANAFGLIGDKGINATRELIQGNAEMSLKARSLIAGQGQGPITEGEQALLVKARAGDINFTKGELNTLFNIFDRAAKAQYDQSRKLLQSATTQSPTAQIFLDAAKPFGAQTAPPVQPAASPQTAPVAQPAQTAPAMPAGFRVIQRGQ
jgi:hypothetical protein